MASFLRYIFGGSGKHYKAPTLDEIQDGFFDAIKCEHTEKLAELCSRYPDFNSWRDDKDRSPLHVAQDSNCLQSFIVLLDHGAKKTENYGNGWTPLLTAINKQQDFFEDFLLDGEKDINGIATDGKNNTWSALHLAVLRKDDGALRELIENGADMGLKAKPKGVEMTAEEYATSLGHKKIAEMLNLAPEIRTMALQRFAGPATPPPPKL
ncbi:MAG: ankyrin repeat domain-containing protein [Alphaproteobacteria bacterium]